MDTITKFTEKISETLQPLPIWVSILLIVLANFALAFFLYLGLYFFAPIPREPLKEEKTYISISDDGKSVEPHRLPCWYDAWKARRLKDLDGGITEPSRDIEDAEVFMTLIIPAYNEENRLSTMLEEAVEFLESEYGVLPNSEAPSSSPSTRQRITRSKQNGTIPPAAQRDVSQIPTGFEILLVSDGSTDNTVSTALTFAREHRARIRNANPSVPQSPSPLRIIALNDNRGKGGAVTHGLRHTRGLYTLFADADGASKFSDLRPLLRACQSAATTDPAGLERAVAIGSRAHLVGTAATVQRSALRNFLMHGFHLFLRVMTPQATSRIRDTQCGFKLFTRSALPDVVPFMHSEGWIFDVEMLMLAEGAGVPMTEVPVGWKEVGGSKLNVMWDSLGMALGLATLRVCWGLGIYNRRRI